ncbi:MAG: ATP phosphoribosyltransferase, partial [bacterium]
GKGSTMAPTKDTNLLRLALPKGRMQTNVFDLLAAASITVSAGERNYRPVISLPHVEVKILKPQNIVEMLHAGARDIGFAGADWVAELGADLVEVLDTGLDPVRLVAAAPAAVLVDGQLPVETPLVVASEYERLARDWIQQRNLQATLLKSYGATEVFPPEDADCIIDNSATGATLRTNDLTVIDELMTSSTRLYVNPSVLDNPAQRARVDNLVLLLRAVLESRRRVMVEMNVAPDRLADLVAILPCMRQPTVSPLNGDSGFAVRVAVLRSQLTSLIPTIKERGGSDIVVTSPSQIIP